MFLKCWQACWLHILVVYNLSLVMFTASSAQIPRLKVKSAL